MTNCKLAIVGRGYWGNVYIQTIKGIKGIEITEDYILGKDYKNKLINNDSSIKGVIVATPPETHFEVANYLIQKGYTNILIEKPLTDNNVSADSLLEVERSNHNLNLMVAHVHLYDPAYRRMKDYINTKLGKVKKITYTSLKSKSVENSTVLKHLSPHPLSIFFDIFDKNPIDIQVKFTHSDNIELKIDFGNEQEGVAIMGTDYPERKREIEIIGSGGVLFLNEFVNPRSLVFTSNESGLEKIEFGQTSALEEQIKEFVSCIYTKKKPLTTIYDGVRVVKTIDKILQLASTTT